MLKPLTAAIAASLATTLLLGVAFASPQQSTAPAARRSITVKFEWVRTQPKSSDMLSIRVDNGQVCTVTGKGQRQITVTPTLVGDDQVTLDLDIQSMTSTPDRLRTRVTTRLGDTDVISAAVTKQANSRTEPIEELLFVTAN